MTLSKHEESTILQVYDAYWLSYITGDISMLASLLSDHYTQIGSVETEVFENKKDAIYFIETTINQIAGKVDMRNRVKKIELFEPFVLVTEHADLYVLTEGNWLFYAKFRASSFLQKKEGSWKFVHQHSSMPDIRADEGENIATEKISRENIELRDAIKRRTIELEQKNRDLAMEAALERVRTVAMGMRKPDDLPGICEVLFNELQSMGFTELRNAMINIHNDEKGTFINYDYSEEIGPSINHLNYTIHPVIEKQIKQIRSTLEAFSQTVFSGQDLADWKAFRKRIGEKDDPRIDNVTALYYYFYSIGTGAIGISTFGPISVEKLEQLKRFRNVFEFAYRRYKDVSQAEAQAREALIESALERVRSRTMGMQKSEELKEVIQVVFEQFVHININIDHTGFVIDYKSRDDYNIWIADPLGVPSEIIIPYFDSVYYNQFNQAKATGLGFFATSLDFEEKNRFYQKLFEYIPGLTEQAKAFYFSCPGLAASTVLLENVGLYIENFSGIPYTDEENAILMRFGKVFEQAYIRFKDLKQAEAQVREAKIEAALERVRSKAMAMHSSEDLAITVDAFFTELISLHVFPRRCGVTLIDEESRIADLTVTTATQGAESKKVIAKLKLSGHPVLDAVFDNWKLQMEFHPVLQGYEIKEYYKVMNPQVTFPDFAEDEKQYGHYFFFNEGGVFAWTDKDLEDDELLIFRRFTSVLSLTYKRYKDLQQAEKLARQAEKDLIKLKEEKKKTEEALTELQFTQKQLIQSEKMASLGELTAGIAHEIQNPLNFVNNFSEINTELSNEIVEAAQKGDLEEIIQLAADIKSNQDKISEHGKRADAIVKGMLQHSRSSSGIKEPTDINKLADEYFRLAYHGIRAKDTTFNVTMKRDFDPTIIAISIMPQDIGRVLLNLYNNAFYAITEKQKLFPATYEPEVIVSSKMIGNRIEIRVKDNGMGIPQKNLDKIFQPFFTTKPTGQGTGLGLSLSYDIVKTHGGELRVETMEGEGSEFVIQLPNPGSDKN